ncbi:hypothetical protein [Actinoalloteichus hymeniacidonis]|uniref:J domain-containing protein n=1 Tax=Actinoalloteichus hymeniacidonis TaxID=340345 RepID=A0AAC9HT46_9PSEU|nr:hypothetical protein [Actinoalloteichus hymeniacidonis]AOS64885.1 hypothetical protein TL08_20470 [Actinoalloteichus hymeniacidonis]MBB5907040.1 hypothetical protein [Actinoalloteichus hymeniacidonis]
MTGDRRIGAEERAALRAFVRRHHPDLGGDPARFAEGLRELQDARRHAELGPGPIGSGNGQTHSTNRFDGPIVFRRRVGLLTRLLQLIRGPGTGGGRPSRVR